MRAKVRVILEECIRSGTIYGYRRAHKYSENPSEEHILQTIDDAIWSEIDDKFEFERNLADEIHEGFDNLNCPECYMRGGAHKLDCSRGRV